MSNSIVRSPIRLALAAAGCLAFGAAAWAQQPSPASAAPQVHQAEVAGAVSLEAQIASGKKVYDTICYACHQPDGKGLPGAFPPLAGSDFLKADRDRPIRIVLKGLTGPVTVNGVTYNSAMPPQPLTDEQVADVLTFVTNSWGNEGAPYTVDDVRRVKSEAQ